MEHSCGTNTSHHCAIGDTASPADLPCPWHLCVQILRVLFLPQDDDFFGSKRNSRTARGIRYEHHSTSAQPTTRNQQQQQQQTQTLKPTQTTVNNQQQMHSHNNSNHTSRSYNSNHSGNTQHQATSETISPSRCVQERTLSRLPHRCPRLRTESQNAAATTAEQK